MDFHEFVKTSAFKICFTISKTFECLSTITFAWKRETSVDNHIRQDIPFCDKLNINSESWQNAYSMCVHVVTKVTKNYKKATSSNHLYRPVLGGLLSEGSLWNFSIQTFLQYFSLILCIIINQGNILPCQCYFIAMPV